MQPTPSIFERSATALAPSRPRWRDLAMWSSFLVPAGLGYLIGRRSRTRGILAGLGGAAALGLLRWQMARWFTVREGYEVERRIGRLEVRRYPAGIEARTRIDTPDLKRALNRGFERLFAYILGGNRDGEKLHMATPVTTSSERLTGADAAIDSVFTMSFVMPRGRLLSQLPRPRDARVELHEHGPRRIAALTFHGAFDRAHVAQQARALLAHVDNAGLSPLGVVSFAAYDGPSTLPLLRHNEVWVEIADPH